MANFWPLVWTELQATVHTVWPEITLSFRSLQAERLNWANLVEFGAVSLPYAVLQTPAPVQDPEWGLQNIVYAMQVSLYYIAENAGTSVQATLEASLKAMQDAIIATVFTNFQLIDGDIKTDVTEYNPVNESNLQASTPFTAGSLTFTIIFGETVL